MMGQELSCVWVVCEMNVRWWWKNEYKDAYQMNKYKNAKWNVCVWDVNDKHTDTIIYINRYTHI